ncbi:hypothetical protein D9613_005535 [Agrocybe pediades]|uniref:FAD-binding FR-type domain-containing protein n=1 Tax=Agrocybe pediades TaxID=84607 RepID=A0A8H4QYF2_9AGAR|nr:hypothetical protein D9613_005535 [Agrocybe pediades]
MWRQLCYKSRLPLTYRASSYNHVSRRFLSQLAPQPVPEDISSGRRYLNLLVGFCAGASIYFFLDDPRLSPLDRPTLTPRQFISSKVLDNEPSGPNTKLLRLALPPHALPPAYSSDGSFDPIWSVYVKDDDIQVERAYTPLNGLESDGSMLFWVKKYPKGEVGRWLHSKQPGDKIELRGPLKTWPWKADQWDEIVMISGGTGITPFVQLFNRVISRAPATSTTKYTLLHCSRVPEELPPPTLLKPLFDYSKEHPEKFNLHLFVDEQDGSNPPVPIPHINTGFINEKSLTKCLNPNKAEESWWKGKFSWTTSSSKEPPKKILFLVCGPEGMVGAVAGPYGRNLSQGPVGGILGKLGYTSDQVYKL